uniref:Amine oxidase n=1 Tax=Ananas comosus var. bracteatus TaxID=296719 RepID=A0A6V7NNN4_ANACO|nr:unnamed protein product [Ananas comosus var. bracteatus]
MAATEEKATPCCPPRPPRRSGRGRRRRRRARRRRDRAEGSGRVGREREAIGVGDGDGNGIGIGSAAAAAVNSLIRAPVEDIEEPTAPPPRKLPPRCLTTCGEKIVGISIMTRAQTRHPLEPLSAAEISVAVATVRAAGQLLRWVRDGMRFIEVVLLEPEKNVVALADAYFFPPFQPSLLPRTKGGAVIPSKLPPRRARLVVYNKISNETSVWIVELSEVHAATEVVIIEGKPFHQKLFPMSNHQWMP